MNQISYGNEITLKEQATMLDDFLYFMFDMLGSQFPDLKLQCGGSALHNNFSIMVNDGVKLELLSKEKIKDLIDNCSECGREFDDDIKKWKLESYVKEGKRALQSHEKEMLN